MVTIWLYDGNPTNFGSQLKRQYLLNAYFKKNKLSTKPGPGLWATFQGSFKDIEPIEGRVSVTGYGLLINRITPQQIFSSCKYFLLYRDNVFF